MGHWVSWKHLGNTLLSRRFNVKPVNLGQDNTTTIQVIRNGSKSARCRKHLDNKVFFLKDCVKEEQLIVTHVPTELMVEEDYEEDYLNEINEDEAERRLEAAAEEEELWERRGILGI
jgi:hypothetical protein